MRLADTAWSILAGMSGAPTICEPGCTSRLDFTRWEKSWSFSVSASTGWHSPALAASQPASSMVKEEIFTSKASEGECGPCLPPEKAPACGRWVW